jgi:hypothetical protein
MREFDSHVNPEAPAPIGHNSSANDFAELLPPKRCGRAADVRRTAEEIRSRYRERWLNPKLPHVVRALNDAALDEDVSLAEFRFLYIVSRNGGMGAEKIHIGNEDLAALCGVSDIRTIRRMAESLESKGRLLREPTYASGKQHVNAYSILVKNSEIDTGRASSAPPETDREGVQHPPKEELGRALDARLGGRSAPSSTGKSLEEEEKDNINLACAHEEGCTSRVAHVEKERGFQGERTSELHPFLDAEDFQNFNDGMNAWIASDPRNQLPRKELRSFTDEHLRQLWRVWTTLHAADIALAAFRSVNLKASRTAAKFAPNFAGYCNFIEARMQGENGALEQTTIAQGKARTKVAGEQAVQQSRVKTQDNIGAQQEGAVGRSISRTEQRRIEAADKAAPPEVSKCWQKFRELYWMDRNKVRGYQDEIKSGGTKDAEAAARKHGQFRADLWALAEEMEAEERAKQEGGQ